MIYDPLSFFMSLLVLLVSFHHHYPFLEGFGPSVALVVLPAAMGFLAFWYLRMSTRRPIGVALDLSPLLLCTTDAWLEGVDHIRYKKRRHIGAPLTIILEINRGATLVRLRHCHHR